MFGKIKQNIFGFICIQLGTKGKNNNLTQLIILHFLFDTFYGLNDILLLGMSSDRIYLGNSYIRMQFEYVKLVSNSYPNRLKNHKMLI